MDEANTSNNTMKIHFFDKLKHFTMSTVHLIHEDKNRSFQGGHHKTRILRDPKTGTSVEEVEMFCETLKFESILKKDEKKPNK